MRFRFVFVIVAVGAFMAFPDALMGQKDGKVGGSGVRQKVDGELVDLQRNLQKNSLSTGRFDFLDKTEKDIRILRKQSARQSDGDEIFMDQIEAVLAEIPRQKNFRAMDCPDYRTNLIAHFEPRFELQPKNSALKVGLKVLAALCP